MQVIVKYCTVYVTTQLLLYIYIYIFWGGICTKKTHAQKKTTEKKNPTGGAMGEKSQASSKTKSCTTSS